ncbi:MAG: Holliday junction branch migration protein RuvA [Anaerolineae bacterium]
MIASLSGSVLFKEPQAAVIEVAGIGFRVFMPKRAVEALRPGQHVQCYTHLSFSPNSGDISLVGFERQEELEMFHLLLGVSGVGMKAALSLIDGLSLDVLRSAIGGDQPEVLTRVTGIGPKTSRRIVLELKDKLGPLGFMAEIPISDDMQLVEALTALGYSVVEAQAAVQSVPAGGSFEDRLRRALAYFAR